MKSRMSRYYRRDEFDDDDGDAEILIPRQRGRIVRGIKALTPKSPAPAKFNFSSPRAAQSPRRERGRSLSRSRGRAQGRSLSRARSAARDENDARNAAPVRRSRSMSRPRRQAPPPSPSRSTHKTIKYKKKGKTVISELSSSDSSPSSSSSSSDDSDSHHRSRRSRNSRNSQQSQRSGPAEDFGTLGEQFVHLLQKNFSQACTTEDIVSPSHPKSKSSKKKKKHRSRELKKHIIVQSDSSSESSSSSSEEEESEDETRLEDLAKANLIIRRRLSQAAKSRSDMEPRESRMNQQLNQRIEDLHRASSRYNREDHTEITELNFTELNPQQQPRSQRDVNPPLRSAQSGKSRQQQPQQHLRYPSNQRQRGGILIDDEDGVFRPNRTSSRSFGDFDEFRQHPPPAQRPSNEGYHRPPPPRRRPAPSANPSQYKGGMRIPNVPEVFDDRTIETRPTHELSEYSITLEQQPSRRLPSGTHSGSFGGAPQRRMPLVEHHSYDGMGRVPSNSSNYHHRPQSSLPDMPGRRGGGMERRMAPLQQRRYERLHVEENSCVSSGSHFQSRKMLLLPIPPGSIDFVLIDTPNGPKVSWAGFASNLRVGDYIVGVENKDTRGLNSMVVTKLLNSKKRKSRVVSVRRIESDEI